jgi:hypothetical protein
MDDLRALHACTIITPDHLPPARVLARSFAEHHPGSRFTALVVGDAPPATSRSRSSAWTRSTARRSTRW